MPSQARADRVAERIAEELAVIFQRQVSDPRFELLTVTDVEVDRELAYATVYVSSLAEQAEREEVLAALEGARGFLRSQLASRINLRSFPRLRFRWDPSPVRGARIDELLDMLKQEENKQEREAGEE
jgi:ribosome-binding factor A